MKKILLLFSVLFLGSVFLCSPALAINTLQLDVSDGEAYYDWSTESIVTAADEFNLLAFLIPDKKATLALTYYISAAVVPKSPVNTDFGSFEIEWTSYDSADMASGTPNADGVTLGHGGAYFPTLWAQISFTFDKASYIPAYDTQEKYTVDPAPEPRDDLDMYVRSFAVDVSGLKLGYEIHFDLYARDTKGNLAFAPYSHDVETVPEPSTMLLLGAGLIGLAAFGRKRFF